MVLVETILVFLFVYFRINQILNQTLYKDRIYQTTEKIKEKNITKNVKVEYYKHNS